MREIPKDVCNFMPLETALQEPFASALDEGIRYVRAEVPTVPGGGGPHVWTYGDQHLEALPGSPSRYGVPDLLGELVAAGSARHREEAVRARLCRMGFL